ncbi:MAG: class C beta-lactamase-related serine hydrolase [Bradyrhizobium sp.]|uniref:serine hydrolase domain-containing protein n=1 Tax=Bradyrhizobium sp. TaxID=376 RepID=UPI00120043A8|nr:serine hydrolase [Bradyrhizobium sp.]THD64929.1 MAG: class C beta-lactamase-related serine hydrolase [Bradyrhizobium sp.]
MRPCRNLMWCAAFVALASSAAAAPDEDLLGKAAGYPVGTRGSWFYDEGVRIGSFSHLDTLLPHYTLRKAASPLPLPAAASELKIDYRFKDQNYTLDDFLDRQRITGLLVIKDGEILCERYQYDRKPVDRFVSHSMAKSIVSIAVGMALAEGKIASLDDLVSKYEPKLAGSAYGDTSIRNVLRMSSGVPFNEVYDGKDDLTRFGNLRGSQGSIAALRAFGPREVEPGTRFHYASSETVILAVLLRAVTGTTLSEYLTERLWQPMGAEADATWIRSRDGTEVAAGSFNAILRDYGRLGVLLANDGAVGPRQVVPKEYLLDATDWHRQPEAFTPRRATPYFGYGYQFWLFPGEKRRFALLGVYGQSIFVDPELKLVMVVTAAAKNASVGKEPLAAERDAVWRGLIGKYGNW